LKKIDKFISNIVVIVIGALLAGIVVSLNVGSPAQMVARYALIGFILLIVAYKLRVPGIPSFGHAVAISASLFAIIIAVGFISGNGWIVILGASFAAYSGWVLLMALRPNLERTVYPEFEDNLPPRFKDDLVLQRVRVHEEEK